MGCCGAFESPLTLVTNLPIRIFQIKDLTGMHLFNTNFNEEENYKEFYSKYLIPANISSDLLTNYANIWNSFYIENRKTNSQDDSNIKILIFFISLYSEKYLDDNIDDLITFFLRCSNMIHYCNYNKFDLKPKDFFYKLNGYLSFITANLDMCYVNNNSNYRPKKFHLAGIEKETVNFFDYLFNVELELNIDINKDVDAKKFFRATLPYFMDLLFIREKFEAYNIKHPLISKGYNNCITERGEGIKCL